MKIVLPIAKIQINAKKKTNYEYFVMHSSTLIAQLQQNKRCSIDSCNIISVEILLPEKLQ